MWAERRQRTISCFGMLLFLGESGCKAAPPCSPDYHWPLVVGAPTLAAFQSFWLLLGTKTLRLLDSNVADLKPRSLSVSLSLRSLGLWGHHSKMVSCLEIAYPTSLLCLPCCLLRQDKCWLRPYWFLSSIKADISPSMPLFLFFLRVCIFSNTFVFSDWIFVFVFAGTFKLLIEFSEEYPNKPPTVRFVSRMFHPNGKWSGSAADRRNDWFITVWKSMSWSALSKPAPA